MRKPCNCGGQSEGIPVGASVWVLSQNGPTTLRGRLKKNVLGVVIAVSGRNYAVRITEPAPEILHITRSQLMRANT
jgi:hypothetical protein